MKITKAKLLIVVVGLVVSLILSLAGLLNLNVKADVAFANTADFPMDLTMPIFSAKI